MSLVGHIKSETLLSADITGGTHREKRSFLPISLVGRIKRKMLLSADITGGTHKEKDIPSYRYYWWDT
jgi:hypothetical protein